MRDEQLMPSEVPEAGRAVNRRLPWRDLWLLPLISLTTLILLFAGAEVTARALWPEQQVDACGGKGMTNLRFKGNCQSTVKIPEGPWVHNTYNECGYRTRESCGVRPAGTIRVAVIGSSTSYGYMNSNEDAYTALLTDRLSRRCNHPVEFQNVAFPNTSLLDFYHKTDEALGLKPDVLMVVVSPLDIRHHIDREALARRDDASYVAPTSGNILGRPTWLKRNIVKPINESRAMYMLQYAVYQDPETYLSLYLLHGDDAGYLKSPFSPAWQERMSDADVLLTEMSQKAHAAGVPMVLVVTPFAANIAALKVPRRPGSIPERSKGRCGQFPRAEIFR